MSIDVNHVLTDTRNAIKTFLQDLLSRENKLSIDFQ